MKSSVLSILGARVQNYASSVNWELLSWLGEDPRLPSWLSDLKTPRLVSHRCPRVRQSMWIFSFHKGPGLSVFASRSNADASRIYHPVVSRICIVVQDGMVKLEICWEA